MPEILFKKVHNNIEIRIDDGEDNYSIGVMDCKSANAVGLKIIEMSQAYYNEGSFGFSTLMPFTEKEVRGYRKLERMPELEDNEESIYGPLESYVRG